MSRVSSGILLGVLVVVLGLPGILLYHHEAAMNEFSFSGRHRPRLRPLQETRIPDRIDDLQARYLLNEQLQVLAELRRRDFVAARRSMRAAIAEYPDAISLYYELLLLELRHGNGESALQLLDMLERDAPTDDRTVIMRKTWEGLLTAENIDEREAILLEASRRLYGRRVK